MTVQKRVHHGSHAGVVGVAQIVGHKIDALHHAATVYPFLAGVPALYGRRIQQVLVHVTAFQSRSHETHLWQFEITHEVQGADDHFSRAFYPGESRALRLEEVRREHQAQHGSNVVAGAEIFGLQRHDGGRIGRGRGLPRRHLHVVSHEEVVQMPADEPRRRGLTTNDLDYVVAVEVAGFAEEGLQSCIVVLRIVTEQPGRFAVRYARYIVVVDGPAGERPGGLLDIVLRVIGASVHTHAHGKQFEEFPSPIFVDRVLVVEIVVQPENHGRIAGQPTQQLLEIAQAALPKQIDLVQHRFLMQHLGQTGGEHAVPEKRDFFLEGSRAGIAVHAVNRFGQRTFDVAAFLPVDVVPLNNVFV